MTLKNYTDFVATFQSLGLEGFESELVKLLGPENSHGFSELLLRKSKENGGQDLILHGDMVILANREFFLSTLAEFCEPLLVKGTTEKPEGGQDAAKT